MLVSHIPFSDENLFPNPEFLEHRASLRQSICADALLGNKARVREKGWSGRETWRTSTRWCFVELAAGTIPYSGIFNRINQKTLAEKPYGTTASKNNPLGERKGSHFSVGTVLCSVSY